MGKEKPKSIEVWPVVKPFVNGRASLTTCVIQPSDMIKDALLTSIAETEKQTELAARVSTWKQRIENNLEEQDSRPPFNIHEYGERILEKLSMDADSGNTISFADVIRGQEKHDVAQTFSTLLQMVYERSLSGSGASPNIAAAAQFVKAEMLPSGYFIRPCKGGGSIIHKVDMLVWISCQAS